ncbi:MAG: sugar kinase [Candidatus Cloacimonetes bacterium]|nr:sugar kinase [Candidatus Cloacimonadota bacterium]
MKISTFGEIMLRLSTVDNERISQSKYFEISFAGSEANVAVNLSIWGEDTFFITTIPNNEIGGSVLYELKRYGVDTSYIKRLTDSRLGTFYIEKGSNYLPSNVIYDRMHSSFIIDTYNEEFFDSAFRNANWFHWSGITPGLGLNTIENIKNATKSSRKLGLTISCDLNYRSKLWKNVGNPKDIMPELLSNTNVIIGNEEDAQIMLDLDDIDVVDVNHGTIDEQYYKQICNSIFKKYPNCNVIAFTLRESKSADHNVWSAILSTRDVFFTSQKYEIKNIVDRVGAGDTFAAGIIYGINNFQDDFQKILEFATAASCLMHSIKGDFCICNLETIFKLMSGNKSGRIVR